jgi:putative effector of murein hydrolase
MNITKRNKIIIAAVALTGAAAMTTSAFTAGGLSDSSNDSFIGGTVDQTITGAVLTDVDYNIGVDDDIDDVAVTVTGNVAGRTLEIEFYDAVPALTGAPYTCTTIAIDGTSLCSPTGTKAKSVDVETVTFRVDN